MDYTVTVTGAELDLIGRSLLRLPPEQIALIEKLRAQAQKIEAEAAAARAKQNGDDPRIKSGEADVPADATEVPAGHPVRHVPRQI
jgi:hypothetical protein